jgi:hypothetical protein
MFRKTLALIAATFVAVVLLPAASASADVRYQPIEQPKVSVCNAPTDGIWIGGGKIGNPTPSQRSAKVHQTKTAKPKKSGKVVTASARWKKTTRPHAGNFTSTVGCW